MLRAYDDPIGLTGAFNLNLLARINRDLGADFDLLNFEHEARWNEAERRIEMHLRSRVDQTAFIAAADLTVRLQAGETIWTESSHKFQLRRDLRQWPHKPVSASGRSGWIASGRSSRASGSRNECRGGISRTLVFASAAT